MGYEVRSPCTVGHHGLWRALLLNDRCSGNSCLHFRVRGDGRFGEKECSDHLSHLKCSFLWCDYGDPQGELFNVLFREWLVIIV